MEKPVRSSFQYLSISYECALAIGNSLNLSEMLHEVIHTMVHKTNAHRGIIWVKNGEKKLQPVASAGINIEDVLAQGEIMDLRDVLNQIQKSRQFVLRYKDDKDFLQYCPVLTEKEESILIVPVANVAILHLVYAVRKIADEPLANLLASLSRKLSIAIEACTAHENIINEVQVRVEAEEELRKKTEQLISSQKELQGLYGKSEQARKSLLSILEDVTQKEKALKDSESKLNSILSSIDDLVFVFDQEDRFMLTQNPASELLYTTPDKFIGKKPSEVLPSHLNKPFLDAFDKIRKGQAAEYDYWLKIKGKTLWFSAKHSPRFIDGELVGSVSVVRDITERKQAQEELERLSVAIEQAAETVVITDSEGTIQYVNPTFEQITGYTREEAIGRNPRFLKSGKHDDVFYKEMWNTLLRGDTWRGRFVNKKKDGTLYTEDTVISPVRDASGRTVNYAAVKRDITEEMKLEEQLRQAQKMESVGRLAGGVAHDFNNMLGVILGHAEMAMEQMDPAQPLFDDLHEIRTAAQRSADLTRQLLAFARKQTVTPSVLDINETVEGMLKMLRRLIGEDIDLAWLPGSGVWSVKVDPSQIDQILANLCVNARDAIEGVGKITMETENVNFDETYWAGHPGFTTGEYVLLTVSDNGCGMDKETLDMLFEPFFTTKEMGNTGLGLATVYGIVKQNNGFINVYSEPGHGTSFKIYLPRHAAKTTQMQKEGPAKPAKRGHETILLVEDEPAILKMTTKILERQGYTVLAASTPSEAIRRTEAHPGEIHLLLTDVVMPEMNGRDLAKNLLSFYPNLKRLFMSGYTANVIACHGVLDEGVNFLQKPFAMQDLAAKVREALDSG